MTKSDQILLRPVLHSPLVQTSLRLDDSVSSASLDADGDCNRLWRSAGTSHRGLEVEWGLIKRIKDHLGLGAGRGYTLPQVRLGL
jgi:hypothetical protein